MATEIWLAILFGLIGGIGWSINYLRTVVNENKNEVKDLKEDVIWPLHANVKSNIERIDKSLTDLHNINRSDITNLGNVLRNEMKDGEQRVVGNITALIGANMRGVHDKIDIVLSLLRDNK